MSQARFARHASMGRRAVLALTLAAAFALAGCGEAVHPDEVPTRTVTDASGRSMQVPANPQRIVALSEPTLDGALALGLTPVGTITGRGQSTVPNYLAELARDIPLLGGVSAPNYEAIAKADPDLILVDGTSINNNADAIGILRNIAPTFESGLAGGDWRANFALVADALGRRDQAQDVMDAYDAKVTQVTSRLGGFRRDTFSVVRWQGGSASLILKELPAGIALSDLGLRRPAGQDKRGRGHSEPVSLENLADIDADQIFFGTLGGSSAGNPSAGGRSDVAGAEDALEAAMKVPGFTSLTAVRNNRVHLVDGSLWTSTGGPLLMSRLIDSVESALA